MITQRADVASTVIGFVFEECPGAVDLLGEEQEGDLVGKSHGGEREQDIGAAFDFGGKARAATDHKQQATATPIQSGLHGGGPCLAVKASSFFGERDQGVCFADLREDALAFDLDGARFTCEVGFVFFFESDQFNRAVAMETLKVCLDPFFEVAVFEPTHHKDGDFHGKTGS